MKEHFLVNLKSSLKETAGLIRWKWTALLLFEVVYKVILLILVQPGLDILKASLDAAGITYLNNQNILQLLKSPVSVLYILLLCVGVIYLSFAEIAVIVLYCSQAAEGGNEKMSAVILKGIRRAAAIFHPQNLWMMGLVLLMLPLSGVLLTTGPLSTLKIPGFIIEFIEQNSFFSILYTVLIVFMILLLFLWVFSIHEFILQPCTFKEARRKSRTLLKGKKVKTAACLAAAILSAFLLAYVIQNAVVAALLIWDKVRGISAYEFWHQYHYLELAGNILFSILRVVTMLAVITYLYYRFQDREFSSRRGKSSVKRFAAQTLKLILVCFIMLLYGESSNPSWYDFYAISDIQVAAHRAGAMFAPENTMAALKEAVKSGAQEVEIDVQQTKDGHLIVLHDTNLKRTAGMDQNVWDVSFEEVRSYDAGSFFGPEFEGENIPSLEEMLKEACGKINMMIELKSTGHEQELEKKTIALIREYRMEKQCTIASMDYSILRRIKELAPELKTVYIAAVLFGNLIELKDADIISLEETFVNASILSQAHSLNKKVYVWTVNSQEDVKRMMNLKVDGIITDNVYLTFFVLETRGISLSVINMADQILGGDAEKQLFQ